MSNKSVHKLNSEIEKELIFIGIASHENDYRISWALNSTIGFNFVKTDNHISVNKRLNETQEFSMYISRGDEEGVVYKLISNRCDNGFLLEEIRNIDFVLVIENKDKLLDISELITKIRTIPFISAAFLLNSLTAKGKNRIK